MAEHTNPSDRYSNNIVLHFNPCWNTNAVVLNSRINGSWGEEVRPSGYDLATLLTCIHAANTSLAANSISLNGEHFNEYRHGLPIESVAKVVFVISEASTPAKTWLIVYCHSNSVHGGQTLCYFTMHDMT